jgi:hypothetical protein
MCGLCAAWSESHLAGEIDPISPKVSNYTQIKDCLVDNSIFALEYSVIRKWQNTHKDVGVNTIGSPITKNTESCPHEWYIQRDCKTIQFGNYQQY